MAASDRFSTSFDAQVTADLIKEWTSNTGGTVAAVGRRSTNGLRISGANSIIVLGFPTASELMIRLAMKPSSLATSFNFLEIGEGSSNHVVLRVNTAGGFEFHRPQTGGVGPSAFPTVNANTTTSFTSLVSSSGGLVTAGTYVHLELYFKVHDSTGAIELRRNGNPTPICTFSGDTRSAGAGTLLRLAMGTGDLAINVDIDDFTVVWGSSTFKGDCRVQPHYPDGAGNSTQFTPTSGSNFQMVDDVTPDGASTINSSSTTNHLDQFTFEDLKHTGAQIVGLCWKNVCKKDSPGSCDLAPSIRHSGTDYLGDAQSPIDTAYTTLVHGMGLNPATAAAWTESDFNAAQFGYKKIA